MSVLVCGNHRGFGRHLAIHLFLLLFVLAIRCRDVSLSLVSAGANETIEEYKNKVIDEQIEAIKGVAPDIVIIEV